MNEQRRRKRVRGAMIYARPRNHSLKSPHSELLAAASVSAAGPLRATRRRWLGVLAYRMSRCNSHSFERTRPHMMNCDCDVYATFIVRFVVDCRSISVVRARLPAAAIHLSVRHCLASHRRRVGHAVSELPQLLSRSNYPQYVTVVIRMQFTSR